MHFADLTIFFLYMAAVLGVGVYFMRRNKTTDDYYVGGRDMNSFHIGLSVVATDVGGGFSIGLGGLGFLLGMSGSWMLLTGLIGAWLSAVFLIPKVATIGRQEKLLTFPQLFGKMYGPQAALIAGIISAIGYTGFTSSQLLAGAKLASATFIDLNLHTALIIMGGIAVVYTVIGGLKAVIYTDTVQWAILLLSLIFIGIPVSYIKLGGWEAISSALGAEFFSLTNVTWQDLVKWAVTIIPIWFVGMTLYQRIYAAKDIKTAKRAWYLAGLFEYPIMAFMGVTLGLLARVAADQGMFAVAGYNSAAGMDHEMGLPLLLRHILPVGLMGIMMAAYFSAIMSTADSCLMAASGNLLTDIINLKGSQKKVLLVSQAVTLLIGTLALLLALNMHDVLTLMFYSYGFMVSGLFIPIIGGLFFKRRSSLAAIMAMLVGGSVTTVLQYFNIPTWQSLDPNVFGIAASMVVFLILNRAFGTKVSALNT